MNHTITVKKRSHKPPTKVRAESDLITGTAFKVTLNVKIDTIV